MRLVEGGAFGLSKSLTFLTSYKESARGLRDCARMSVDPLSNFEFALISCFPIGKTSEGHITESVAIVTSGKAEINNVLEISNHVICAGLKGKIVFDWNLENHLSN